MKLRPLLLAASLLLGGLGRATTVQTLSLAQQAKKADVIVQATILTPTTATEGGQTYAVYPLKVSETLAGDAATLPQTVGSQNGSGPALYVLSGVDTAPVFQAGQEAVLLLYKGRLDSPLVGYNQGAYLISNGLVSPLVVPVAAGQTGPGQIGVGQAATGQAAAGQNVPVANAATLNAPALSQTGTPLAPPSQNAGTTVGAVPVTPTTPTASNVPGTASDAGAGASNRAATGAAATNPATAVPGIATTPPGTATPANGTPPISSTTPPNAVPSGTAASGSAAASTGTASPAASQVAPATPAAGGVLGTIRTPAELKAAIVAARAAK